MTKGACLNKPRLGRRLPDKASGNVASRPLGLGSGVPGKVCPEVVVPTEPQAQASERTNERTNERASEQLVVTLVVVVVVWAVGATARRVIV